MKIRVIGSAGADYQNYHCCAFLINERTLLDAGTITSGLTMEEQRKITAVLISHAHLDHVKDLCFLAENLAEEISFSVWLISTKEVLGDITRHILNGRIWPDFTRFPVPSLFRLSFLKPGVSRRINGLRVRAVPVNHRVPAVGFLISDGSSTLLYSGNTGPTWMLWRVARRVRNLKGAILEVSFPNRLEALARRSYHLTPSLLQAEVAKMGHSNLPVYVCHMKPPFMEEIREELTGLDCPVRLLTEGETIEIR